MPPLSVFSKDLFLLLSSASILFGDELVTNEATLKLFEDYFSGLGAIKSATPKPDFGDLVGDLLPASK